MGWPTDFITRLWRGKYEPHYLLEWVEIPAGSSTPFGMDIKLSSFPHSSYLPIISRADSYFRGGTLNLRTWNCDPCEFAIGIMGNSSTATDVRLLLQRGQGVVLKVGFDRNPANFVPVAFGTVVGLGRSSAGWSIRCRGIEGGMASRIDIAAAQQVMGWDLASTETTSGYTNGTTLAVTSTAGFRTDGLGTGVVLVTPDSPGDPYYVKYTGTSGGNTFTGCSTGHFGTAFSTTSGTKAVAEVMYTAGHPLKVAERILTSTGLGTNGADDILPESWGLGIAADAIHDRDINAFLQQTQPASGSASWHWVQSSTIDNPQDALSSWLNGAGYFLTNHRGLLTARAALLPWSDRTDSHFTLTDSMIIPESIEYDAWHPDTPVEYARARMLYADGTTADTSAASPVDHLPGRLINPHTMGGVWSDTSNAAAITTEALGRMAAWDQRVSESLRFQLRGWWPGIAAPGDTVGLELGILTSRTGAGFRGRAGLITRCQPDWFGSTTEIEIAAHPEDEGVAWAGSRT